MKHLRDEAPHWRGGYVGGIWQSVRLVASHPVFTRDVFVEPDIAGSRTRVLPVNRDVRPHPARRAPVSLPLTAWGQSGSNPCAKAAGN